MRLKQGDYFEAEIALTEALEITFDPAIRAELTHDLAAVAVARGDPAAAVRLLEPLVERPGARRESIALLARALSLMGREGEAKALLEGRR